MRLAIMGNRPKELGGFKETIFHNAIKRRVAEILREQNPDIVYTTMSMGVDHWAAELCLESKIPYIACVPFLNYALVWTPKLRQRSKYLLRKAAKVIEVDRVRGYIHNTPPGVYHSSKIATSRQYIIDQLVEDKDKLAVFFDSRESNDSPINVARQYYSMQYHKDYLIQITSNMKECPMNLRNYWNTVLNRSNELIWMDDVPF